MNETSPQPLVPNTNVAKKPKPAFLLPAVMGALIVLLLAGVGLSYQKATTATKNGAKQATKANELEGRLKKIEGQTSFVETQIDKDKYQAIFIAGGQVYFAKITQVTQDSMKIEDIYYLRNGDVDQKTQAVTGADISLVKLGNELHGPDDVMYLERKNVLFWENLKADGQVSKAIADYKKQNP